MNLFNPLNMNSRDNLGPFFEILCSVILELGGKFQVINEKGIKSELILKKSTPSEKVKGGWKEFMERCSQLPLSSQDSDRKLFLPESTNQPVIDMMDARDRLYQITIGKSHGINLKHLQKIEDQLGLIKDNFKLNLYFVIPESNSNMKFGFVGELEVHEKVEYYEKKNCCRTKKIVRKTTKSRKQRRFD